MLFPPSLSLSLSGSFPDSRLCILHEGETSVCTVGLRWSEERWDMSMCAAVHMKATWLSPALWFMPLITTTQRCFQQQQSSAEGWQQWDTCQSGDEKMFFFCEVAVSIVTLIYFFFSFVLFICLDVFLYILSKVIDEAKCEVESVFHLLTGRLPPPVRRRQCASLPPLWLINRLISAGLSFLLSYSDRKKHASPVWFLFFLPQIFVFGFAPIFVLVHPKLYELLN